MFKRFFYRKEPRLSKAEAWQKFELFELFDDLKLAEKILSKLRRSNLESFTSLELFYTRYVEELNDLKHQNVPDFKQICLWFAPTWDDHVGIEGVEIGNRIYERANKWNKVQLKP